MFLQKSSNNNTSWNISVAFLESSVILVSGSEHEAKQQAQS